MSDSKEPAKAETPEDPEHTPEKTDATPIEKGITTFVNAPKKYTSVGRGNTGVHCYGEMWD